MNDLLARFLMEHFAGRDTVGLATVWRAWRKWSDRVPMPEVRLRQCLADAGYQRKGSSLLLKKWSREEHAALQASLGWPNLRNGNAKHKALGWPNLKKAVEANRKTGFAGLKKAVANRKARKEATEKERLALGLTRKQWRDRVTRAAMAADGFDNYKAWMKWRLHNGKLRKAYAKDRPTTTEKS